MTGTFDVLPVYVAVDPDEHVVGLMALIEANGHLTEGLNAVDNGITELMKLETITPEYLRLYAKAVTVIEELRGIVTAQDEVIESLISEFMPTEDDG